MDTVEKIAFLYEMYNEYSDWYPSKEEERAFLEIFNSGTDEEKKEIAETIREVGTRHVLITQSLRDRIQSNTKIDKVDKAYALKVTDGISLKMMGLDPLGTTKLIYSFTSELEDALNNQADSMKNEELYLKDIFIKLPAKSFIVLSDRIFRKRWRHALARIGGNLSALLNDSTEVLGFSFQYDDLIKSAETCIISTLIKWKNKGDMYEQIARQGAEIDDVIVFNFKIPINEGKTKLSDLEITLFTDNKVLAKKLQTDILSLCLPYVLYLSSINREVSEKKYHVANKKVKKKIEKVNTFSCGEEFSLRVRNFKAKSSSMNGEDGLMLIGEGKSKAPHIRRAHWHHYWKGKRNGEKRELIMRWIEPTFIHKELFVNQKPVNVRVN